MKKVKNYITWFSCSGLEKILNNEDLLIKDWNNLIKTYDSVLKQYNFLKNKHDNLVKKYGEEKENTVFELVPNTEGMIKFNKDFNELLNLDEEIDVRSFNIELVTNTKLKYIELDALRELFKENKKD